MINEELTLNANIRSVKQIIHATQGENGSRTLEITIIGTDGEILNLDGCTISFYVSKNDGKIAMLPVNISGNTARVTLTEQSCSVAGDNDCWIQIVKSSETAELRVDNLVLRVQACDFDGAVESSNEFSALGKLISDASEAIENANQAATDVRADGEEAIKEIQQNFDTAMVGFNQEIDEAVKKAEDAASTSENIARETAAETVNSLKGQPNGIASLNAEGELEQAPPESVMFLAAHPVGSLFETTVSTNPGTLYGGTWAAWGGGRTPVGVNTADTSFNTVEKTGGEKTHTLTIEEMPAHTHDIKMRRHTDYSKVFLSDYYGDPAGGTGFQMDIQMGMYVPYTGGGQAHNNLQPYITCYIWKRTT